VEHNRTFGIGSVLFFYEALTANNNDLAVALRQGVYKTNAAFPKEDLLKP
jgi:hypothetical protein